MHHLKVTVSGKVYEVQVELLEAPSQATAQPDQPAKTAPKPLVSNTGASQPILSPLAASVVSIDTTLGASTGRADGCYAGSHENEYHRDRRRNWAGEDH